MRLGLSRGRILDRRRLTPEVLTGIRPRSRFLIVGFPTGAFTSTSRSGDMMANTNQNWLCGVEPALQDHVKIPCIQPANKRRTASHSARFSRLFLVVPNVVDRCQLSELLRLLRPFHSSPLLANGGDVDQRRPRTWDRRARALEVHLVVQVTIAKLDAIGVVSDCMRRGTIGTLSSHLERAQSADMTTPPGPTQ